MGSVRSSALLSLVAGLLLAPAGSAQSPGRQSVNAMCRTPAATGDGVGYRCVSEPTRLQAPDGYAFARESLQGGVSDSAGPEPRCEVQWSDEVVLAPGGSVQQPRLLTVRASASSQRGYGRRGPGWTECTYTVDVVPYALQ